jgi:hypothetical protein
MASCGAKSGANRARGLFLALADEECATPAYLCGQLAAYPVTNRGVEGLEYLDIESDGSARIASIQLIGLGFDSLPNLGSEGEGVTGNLQLDGGSG